MNTIPLLFLIITTIIVASNCSYREDNEVSHLIFKRYSRCNTDCSNSCKSCSHSSCSSDCNSCISNNCCQNCCQNQCNVCQTSCCQEQSSCRQCCQTHCKVPKGCCTTTSTKTTEKTTTEDTTEGTTERMSTTEGVTIVPRPPPEKTVENRSQIIKESMSIDTKHDVQNKVFLVNNISVPINITNTNVLTFISRSRHESNLTSHPPRPDTSTDKPQTTTKSPKSQVIIIKHPTPAIRPITNLPCYSGSSCHHTRPYWSGEICNSGGGFNHLGGWGGGYGGWSGYGGYGDWNGYGGHGGWNGYGGYGFGHGLNSGQFGGGGCRSFNQDCNFCGSDFYNQFSQGSDQFSSCYGCFV